MIFAGDIGGTWARFAYYENGERIGLSVLDTGGFRTAGDLLAAAKQTLALETAVDAACLAVAGPVRNGKARLTNGHLEFTRAGMAEHFSAGVADLVNDMVALGAAVSAAPDDAFERLGGTVGDGAKGVIAAGTGLGMGIVVGDECLPSEGGHARVAPVGAFERELLAFGESEVDEHGGVVAWEHWLSGRGLVALYRAVCAVWGAKAEPVSAEDITRRGQDDADPVCRTTLETWCGLLATAAGGLAATALTFGGVYLTGSLCMAMADMIRSPLFRRRFEDAAWAADYLAGMPIYLVGDLHAGVFGANIVAQRMLGANRIREFR